MTACRHIFEPPIYMFISTEVFNFLHGVIFILIFNLANPSAHTLWGKRFNNVLSWLGNFVYNIFGDIYTLYTHNVAHQP